MTTENSTSKKVPLLNKTAYGLGTGGGCVFNQIAAAFLLNCCTDTAMIAAGAIMGGCTMTMPRREAVPAFIMAGCDMLVFTTDLEKDQGFPLDAPADGRLTMARLDEDVGRVLALKAKICFQPVRAEAVDAVKWCRERADKAATLVKDLQTDALPMIPERYPDIRLIALGKDSILDGSVAELAQEYLEEQGFRVERYAPMADELHGTKALCPNRMTLYIANYEHASNQTVVRINWCPKHALDMPRFLQDEVSVFVSLVNPCHLQDVPRIKTCINAYTAAKDTIQLTIDKLMGRSGFYGVSPVDPFCGLPDVGL